MSGEKDIDDELAGQDDLIDDGLDDSYDDGEAGDDEEFADEDWESYDEEGGESGEEEGAPRKKGGSNFNKIVIGATVVIGLGVLGLNVMKGGPAPQQPAAVQQTANAPATQERVRLDSASLSSSAPTTQRDVVYGRNREEAQDSLLQEDTQPIEGGLLNNPSEVEKIERYREKLEGELEERDDIAPVPGVTIAQDAQPQPAETPQIVNQDPPMPVPMAQADVLTPLPPMDEAATPSVGLPRAQDLTMAGSDVLPPADVPVDVPAETPSAALTETAPAPLMGDEPAIVMEPASAAVGADAAAELNGTIRELQAALDSQNAKVKDLESTVQQLERALEARTAEITEAREAARASKPRAAAPSSARTSNTNTAPKKAAPTVRWVLKSAQPGQAMVSRAGEHEMRNVTVGDTLPGVGRVQQIYQSPAGWVVEGTSGRILQ